ncbi:MAG TPA: DUF4157 domain-containing protein [Kofleriaceae bacterium]|nr:DUF4157 domain-containing protein [Kofleriaceae bacterium]
MRSSVQVAPTLPPILRRACARCADEERAGGGSLRRQAVPGAASVHGAGGAFAPPSVHATLASGGAPLPADVSARMGHRFGHDFSTVRVHADAAAGASAEAVDARAYTVGHHIVFARGELAPGTGSGERLLAHELAHTIQQEGSGSALQRQIAIGDTGDPEEAMADRMADAALRGELTGAGGTEGPGRPGEAGAAGAPGGAAGPAGAGDPAVGAAPVTLGRPAGPAGPAAAGAVLRATRAPVHAGASALRLRRQQAPQRRGEAARSAILDMPNRGLDQVRVHIQRYLCNCAGRDVTREQTRVFTNPDLGVTYTFCRGRATVRLTGRVTPSTLTTGTVSGRLDLNISPQAGGPGARLGLGVLGRNTGSEPQLGGSADLRLRIPGVPDLGLSFDVLRGMQTGQIDTELRGGVDLGGGFTLGGSGTNLQDARRGGQLIFGGDLPGERVEERICRVCRCPVVYDCIENVPSREYTEQVPGIVTDRRTLRYYFRLDTTDTIDARTNPDLAAESQHTLDEVARLVGDGWTMMSIWGYASPEAIELEHNEPLSQHRAERLQTLLTTRLGTGAQVPTGIGGGELLGRLPSAQPDSQLSDAIRRSGFSGPEDLSLFLFGDEIPNDQLADQFLGLLNATPADQRTLLFGVPADSPLAARLTTAINLFIARRGRGRRPWEALFQYLRIATVELAHPRTVMHDEIRHTSGSVRQLPRSECDQVAAQAEGEGRFGDAEAEPTRDTCPTGDTNNVREFASRCDYTS